MSKLTYTQMSNMVDDIDVVDLCDESKQWLDSYIWLAKKESGPKYHVGTPQTITWLAMWADGRRSRSLTALHTNNASVKKLAIADIGAVAPLNVTPSRIITAMEYPEGSRANVRFNVLRKINPKTHPDFHHWLGQLQFAIQTCMPIPIMDDKTHYTDWRMYDSSDFRAESQRSWRPIKIVVRFKSGATETWTI